jgi:UDP-2-acetamido-3-amino-2,3-dideoxy-glucuronate N-acetyltransferase
MMPRIHPTAIVEDGVVIGDDTSVWDNAHIRAGVCIGSGCIVGDKAYIGPGVVVGDLVKLNTSVYLCTGVTIERGVMVSAHVVFTNDMYPRATDPDLTNLQSSEPNDETMTTVVREGATIGAAAVIGPGVEIGRFAMVGMGSVVTRSVAPFHLVVGNPAHTMGFVCRCGHRLRPHGSPIAASHTTCSACGRIFAIGGEGEVAEMLEG